MKGFKNKAKAGFINTVIAHLVECSKQMKADCMTTNNYLQNHESIITNKLTANYLNKGPNIFRFHSESQEHFDNATGRFIGRIDLKVTTFDHFRDEKAYYIIECKRIDGQNVLNKKYITEGVERFFSPATQPKYSSYYSKNIMFGYVVEIIDIPNTANNIERLQKNLLDEAITPSRFVLVQSDTSLYYVYRCGYVSKTIGQVELSHLFFDFADVVCKN